MIDQLNDKTNHFYRLLFELDTLHQSQYKNALFSPIISYLEDNHLPSNKKRQNSIIAELNYYLLSSDLLFHFATKSSKTEEDKFALCILLELCDKLFDIYHSDLLTSHQGLTRTYYKIRQDFFIQNLLVFIHHEPQDIFCTSRYSIQSKAM